MRLAVTGITSGVGRRLAEVARERGDQVTGLVRDPKRGDARELAALGVALVEGDLSSERALRELTKDADVVFHAAAHVGDWGPPEEFQRVNVEGTRSVLVAAGEQGAKRFVQLSSSAVYGRPDRGRVTEEWPTLHSGMPYEDTKTDAERLVFDRGSALGLEVVAVRPPIIYGPHDRNFMPRALEALAKRRFPLIDGGHAPLNLVWVDHVVDVMLRCAEQPGISGEAFNVMDEVSERPPSVREVALVMAREAGLPPPGLSVPYPVAYALGAVVHGAFSIAKVRRPPPISPFVAKLMTRHVIYDASKAVRVLSWKPRLRALEGIAKYARYFADKREP